jgi:hypothetical protein
LPALFAYLIAVGLLLGGGYGALSWLAAPEPVTVAAKAKPKSPLSPRHNEPKLEDVSRAGSVPTSSFVGNSNQAAAASSEQRTGSGSVEEPRAQVQIAELTEAPQNLSANAEASSIEINRRAEISWPDSEQARQSAQAMSPASPSKTATFIASKEVKRLRSRQGGSGSERSVEKRTLVVMTLRTIEFPDGRRVSQLIPYRNGARRMAFEAEE